MFNFITYNYGYNSKTFTITDKWVKRKYTGLDEYYYNCGDGCCTNYGTTTTVNGKELDQHCLTEAIN